MSKKDPPDLPDQPNQEDNLFRKIMANYKDIKIITSNKHTESLRSQNEDHLSSRSAGITKSIRKPSNNYSQQLSQQLSENLWRTPVTAEEYLSYFKPGLQAKTIKNLKAGNIAIESRLDLHEKTKNQAADLFARFIANSYQNNLRCICIIHGKGSGHPILKNLVHQWLYEIEEVLGFCSCPPFLGGTGAILILLKNNKYYCL